MGTEAFITAVVRQVTVLTAQLATAGGVRAPLAQVADQVFLDLARELQAQGVGRKVSADMFGMALRAYQKKLGRLQGGGGTDSRSLWADVLRLLEGRDGVPRGEVLTSFRNDDAPLVKAVLHDLTGSGLISVEGDPADNPVYRLRDSAQGAVDDGAPLDDLLTVLAYREGPITADALATRTGRDVAMLESRLQVLVNLGRIERAGDAYRTLDFSVPLGSERGWEAAVLDHVQAMVRAIGQRLGDRVPRGDETVGGSTYSFDIWEGHPLAAEVDDSLRRFRGAHTELRERVDAYNKEHGRPDRYRQVVVYGGQYAIDQEQAEDEANDSSKE